MEKRLVKLVSQGLRFIAQRQQADGSFASYSSSNPTNFNQAIRYPTTFATSVIGCCLAVLPPTPLRDRTLAGAVRFLADQASPDGSLNYWVRQSAVTNEMPYPDDLDDTFYALAALTLIKPTTVDGALLAKAITLLTTAEVRPGGPYRTWLVDRQAPAVWRDVDPAVNFTIGYFLSLHNVRLPALVKLAETKIRANDFRSAYYPNQLAVIYLLSRFYRGRYVARLVGQLVALQKPDGSWGTPLNTALALISLRFLGSSTALGLERARKYLIHSAREGVWPSEGFCLDPALAGRPRYAGSAELTTAFCLQALSLTSQPPTLLKSSARPLSVGDQRFFELALREVETASQALPVNLRRDFQQLARRITDLDAQVVLLPRLFSQAIGLTSDQVSRRKLIRLALANLYGWMAYTIYDDFYDDEGRITQLAVANLCARRLTGLLLGAVPTARFRRLFHQTLDQIDAANTWEVRTMNVDLTQPVVSWPALKTAYPIGRLSQKSLGHALTPIALTLLKEGTSPADVQTVRQFFERYLIARQINDDLHDWEADLLSGRLTYTIKKILADVGTRLPKKATAKAALPLMREIFWQKTVADLTTTSLGQLSQASSSLRSPLFTRPAVLEVLIEPVRAAAEKTLTEQQQMASFLAQYQP